MTIELVFPVFGQKLKTDHAYLLYSALSNLIGQFHESNSGFRFLPIQGVNASAGYLAIDSHSKLVIRFPQNSIRDILPLSGKRLTLDNETIRLGVPTTRTLISAPSLYARIVTFKNAETPEDFLETARKKLAELGIQGSPSLPIHLEGERAGQPKRKVLRIHQTTIVGYSLFVSELTAEDSIKLQEEGLGGRTQMGCGFFVPFNPRVS